MGLDPDPDLANLKSRIRIKVIRIRNTAAYLTPCITCRLSLSPPLGIFAVRWHHWLSHWTLILNHFMIVNSATNTLLHCETATTWPCYSFLCDKTLMRSLLYTLGYKHKLWFAS
jgi:hypothetical protein